MTPLSIADIKQDLQDTMAGYRIKQIDLVGLVRNQKGDPVSKQTVGYLFNPKRHQKDYLTHYLFEITNAINTILEREGKVNERLTVELKFRLDRIAA